MHKSKSHRKIEYTNVNRIPIKKRRKHVGGLSASQVKKIKKIRGAIQKKEFQNCP